MTFGVQVSGKTIASYTYDGIPYLWKSGDITTLPSNPTKKVASDPGGSDQFGRSVAVGSGRIVVSSPYDDDKGSDSGSAYIFDLDGNQLTKITASDGASTDYFGWSVAVGSGRIVVGARLDDDKGSNSGSAYIFDLNGTQLAKITASDGAADDYFGHSVAVGSGRIVVGAYLDDDKGSASGSAYIFDLDGNQLAKITAFDGAANDYFGYSVAVGSGRIVVGAYGDESGFGSAYIFDLDGNLVKKITASDGAAFDNFGRSVAVGSGRIVVGAVYNYAAYVFDLNGNELKKITPVSVIGGVVLFALSTSVGSGRIICGDYGTNSYYGAIHVYDLEGNPLQAIGNPFGANSDYFGFSVAVGCGKIVVGVPQDDDTVGNSGSCWIYDTPSVHTLYDAIDLQN